MTFEDYSVVVNDEDQYSIWPTERAAPAGWRPTGFTGTREDCLSHVDEVWTDMRPASLRAALAEAAARPAPESEASPDTHDLVARLCTGEQRVQVVLRPEATIAKLREAIESRYVHVLFPDTVGGTEVGVALDVTDLSAADFAVGIGTVRLEGDLTLDFRRLRCGVSIDVTSLTGHGTLHAA